MKLMPHLVFFSGVFLAGVFLLTGCGTVPATVSAEAGTELSGVAALEVKGITQLDADEFPKLRIGAITPGSLDPAFAITESELDLAGLLFRPLTQLDEDSQSGPGAAVAWSTTDNRHWTFELDPDAVFHNGEVVTAGSFVASMMYLAGDSGSPHASLGGEAAIAGYGSFMNGEADTISGLVATDDFTLSITLEEPNPLLPSMLAHTAFSPRSGASLADPAAEATRPNGNGPFSLAAEWDGASAIDLVPAAGAGHVVRFELFESPDSMFADDTLDISHVPGGELRSVRSGEVSDRLLERVSGSYTYFGFPLTLPPFDDPRVRTALSLAIDRDRLVRDLLGPSKIPATGFTPAGSPGSTRGDCAACTFDPEEARRLMKAAGGFPEVGIDLAFNTGKGHEEWVQAVGAQWSEVFGVDVSFRSDGPAPYFEAIETGTHNGPYRLRWSSDFAHAMSFIEPLFVGGSSNTVGYRNSSVDEFTTAFHAIDDPYGEEAVGLVSQMTVELSDDMPIVPLFAEVSSRLISPDVSGVTLNMDGSVNLGAVILDR